MILRQDRFSFAFRAGLLDFSFRYTFVGGETDLAGTCDTFVRFAFRMHTTSAAFITRFVRWDEPFLTILCALITYVYFGAAAQSENKRIWCMIKFWGSCFAEFGIGLLLPSYHLTSIHAGDMRMVFRLLNKIYTNRSL